MLQANDLHDVELEGYRVTVEIGASSSSRLFLGESIAPGAPHPRVIIQFLPARVEKGREQQRILQKLLILQNLRHPHILPVLFTGIYQNTPYLITEDITVGSLQEHLQKKPLAEEEALRILTQISQALHCAHQQHIVHGQLRPSNILFNNLHEVLVTDFQLHSLLTTVKKGEDASPEEDVYLAPEQLEGQTSEKSDQYALGCIAYELFTGCKVFRVPSPNIPDRYYKTKTLIPPRKINPDIPLFIEEAILTALSREPAERYFDTLAFLSALGEISSFDVEDFAPPVKKTKITPDREDTMHEAPEILAGGRESAALATPLPAADPAPKKHSRRQLASRYQQILALIACLVVIVIAVNILMIAFKFSAAHKTSKVQATYTSAVTPSGTQTTTAIAIPSTTLPSRTPGPHGGLIPPKLPSPTHTPAPTPRPLPPQVQVLLSAFFNNSAFGNAPGQADFDGSGYCYPADQLPKRGLITLDGVSYLFPGNALFTNQNISASGQTIPLTTGHYRQIFLLTSASWGPVSGTLTVHYTDGSTSDAQLTVPDWLAGSAHALSTTFRYSPSGIDANASYIYAMSIAVDPARTADELLLPDTVSGPQSMGQMHVFAVTLRR